MATATAPAPAPATASAAATANVKNANKGVLICGTPFLYYNLHTIFGITGTCVSITPVDIVIQNDVNEPLDVSFTSGRTGNYGTATVNANINSTFNTLKNSFVVAEYSSKHILKFTVVSGKVSVFNYAASGYTLIAIKAATGGRIRIYE